MAAAATAPRNDLTLCVAGAGKIALALAADLVDEGDIGKAAALRLPHEVGVAALLGTKKVDVQHQ
jgi:hypothetical protein